MSLTALIAAGQRGQLIQTIAVVVSVDELVARAALQRLLAAIARRLSERAADPLEHEILLDVIARGGFQRYLDDRRFLFGRKAVREGEEVLAYLYGSVEAAREDANRIGAPAGLDRDVFARLMTLAAILLFGAAARRLEQQAHDRSAGSAPADMLKELGRTILRGLADGTGRTLFRRLSFRRRLAALRWKATWRRLDRSASRRPTLDELLGGLLNEEAKR